MSINELKKRLLSRHDLLTGIIESCKRHLNGCPDGRIRIKRQDKWVSYFLVTDNNDTNGKVIKDLKLVKRIAQKQYLQSLLNNAQAELKALDRLISHYDKTFEDIYPSLSKDRKELINPVTLPDDEFIEQWMNKPYTPKGFKEGTPVYMTMRGERVRSKSEQLIADRLYKNNIPYKYECPLVIDDIVFHPDFTILRMSDRKVLYYEHLGKMDDPGYAHDNIMKLNHYGLNNIVIGDNLFTSFETQKSPLDVRILEQMIQKNFK